MSSTRLYLEMSERKFIYRSIDLSQCPRHARQGISEASPLRPKSEVALATRAERSCGFRGRRGVYGPFKPRPR